MNDLWEEYIYRQLLKNKPDNWLIRAQNSKHFWKLNNSNNRKVIRPDIVIHDRTTDIKIILDTKWKLPVNNIPSDDDLKQMYVYNEYWIGKNAILLYPNGVYSKKPYYQEGSFINKDVSKRNHSCGIMKMAVLDDNNRTLDKTIGKRINDFLKLEILK
jgi:5-methylcytosine-specific restriction enzyme subunit McrC